MHTKVKLSTSKARKHVYISSFQPMSSTYSLRTKHRWFVLVISEINTLTYADKLCNLHKETWQESDAISAPTQSRSFNYVYTLILTHKIVPPLLPCVKKRVFLA